MCLVSRQGSEVTNAGYLDFKEDPISYCGREPLISGTGGRSSGWPEKSVSNVLDVLPGWRCKASCTMMGLSRTRRFQPEALGGMGNTEPLCL